MEFLDIVIALLLIWGLWKGLKNGLFVEISSIIAVIAGIFGAIHFSYIAGDYLSQNMQWNERYINLSSFIITFIIIVLAIHFAGKLFTKIADFAMIGLVNKIAGGIFGTLKIAIILGAILVFFERVNSSVGFVKNETMQNSVLYEPVKDLGAIIFSMVLKNEDETE